MKTLLLLLLCGQFTVEVITEPKVSKQTFTVDVVTVPQPMAVVANRSKPASRKRYLAMFTATYCGPCQTMKMNVLPDVKRRGYLIKEYEMTDSYNHKKFTDIGRGKRRITAFPTFVVCDWETGEWTGDPIVGPVSAETLIHAIESTPLETRLYEQVAPQQDIAPPQQQMYRTTQGRYYIYQGTQYDLETYGGCSVKRCGMCIEIRAAQQRYFDSKRLINDVGPQAASPEDVVVEALVLMQLNQESVLSDLGCGDGSVLIAAVRQSGCRGIGVEIDPIKVEEARRMIADHGLSHRIEIIQGDVRDFDPSRHSVTHIYAYLYEDLLKEISDKLASVSVAVCPGHECPGIGMKLVGQCWVRRS